MIELTVSALDSEETVYKFARKYFEGYSLGMVEKMFRLKDVKANGKKVDKEYVLKENDVLRFYVTDAELDAARLKKASSKPHRKPDIIYEDENIIICNKMKGMLVHGDKTEKKNTLLNLVTDYLFDKKEYNPQSGGFHPALAHRIDRNTSGLVVFAKNKEALHELEGLFTKRDAIHKYYTLLVLGHTEKKGTIDKPLYVDDEKGIVTVRSISEGGKEALTSFETKEYFKKYSLVEAEIHTGRTHQIRVHFSSINHPILGDVKYGKKDANRDFDAMFSYTGQFLHSSRMKFDEVEGLLSYLSGKEFSAPLGNEERKILSILREK